MIRHVVLFKFENDLELKHEFEKLVKSVPVKSFQFGFGPTFTTRGGPWTHIFSIDFESKEMLEEYSKHPIHVEFVNRVVKQRAILVEGQTSLAMDIEL
jgi:hypothetical protein